MMGVAKLRAALLLGLSFLNQNMWKLAGEDEESMPIGFELAFPSLIEIAKSLGVDFPYDHQALQGIYSSHYWKHLICRVSPPLPWARFRALGKHGFCRVSQRRHSATIKLTA